MVYNAPEIPIPLFGQGFCSWSLQFEVVKLKLSLVYTQKVTLHMAPVKDEKFLPEIWALYAISVFWAILRFAVRIRTTGIYGLQIDDGFALLSVICWTVIIVGIHITYYSGTNVDYSAAEVWGLTGHQIEQASFGTKIYVITAYM